MSQRHYFRGFKNKKCALCSNQYQPNSSNQKFCDHCRMKTCVVCGKIYYAPKKYVAIEKSRYCSIACYAKDRWQDGKKCKACGNLLPETRARYCSKKCQRDYWNKNDYHINKKQRMRERKNEIIKLLGGKCVNCGNADARVLDIHHKDKTKKIRPPKLHYTMENRLKEWGNNIKNLELLCANCHRIHTWEERGHGNEEDKQ